MAGGCDKASQIPGNVYLFIIPLNGMRLLGNDLYTLAETLARCRPDLAQSPLAPAPVGPAPLISGQKTVTLFE